MPRYRAPIFVDNSEVHRTVPVFDLRDFKITIQDHIRKYIWCFCNGRSSFARETKVDLTFPRHVHIIQYDGIEEEIGIIVDSEKNKLKTDFSGSILKKYKQGYTADYFDRINESFALQQDLVDDANKFFAKIKRSN